MRRTLLLALAGFVLLAPPVYGTSFTDRMDSIPDITQTDPKADFPYGGVHYCGPCAISNSLVWLGENGYEKLLPKAADRMRMQVALVNIIASPKYMDTTLEWGTSPAGVLQGIDKYLEDCGYRNRRLSYQGYRKVPAKFANGTTMPQLDWVKAGLSGDSAVWLNVGWYRYSARKGEYVRLGGHWVTMVGFGKDENGQADPNVLIVHDPGAPSGENPNGYIRVMNLEAGRKLVTGSGRPLDSGGLYKLRGGLRISNNVDAAVLDGAIRLEMGKPDITASFGNAGSLGACPIK